MIARVLNACALAVALITLFDWFARATVQISGGGAAAFMTPTTALMFVFSAVQSEIMRTRRINGIGHALVAMCSMSILFLLLGVLTGGLERSNVGWMLGYGTGLLGTQAPHPAVTTMIGFFLCAIAGLFWLFHVRIWIKVAAALIGIIGCVTLAGYCFHIETLYRPVPSWSYGMAWSTAACFVLLSLSMLHDTKWEVV